MNHFDAVDFSECHSEEVISFFSRSVYNQQTYQDVDQKHCEVNKESDSSNNICEKIGNEMK